MDKHNKNKLILLDALITAILNDLPIEVLVSIADLDEDEFRVLELVQGKYIKFWLDQLTDEGIEELLKECREKSGDKSMGDAGVSVFILRELWKQLT